MLNVLISLSAESYGVDKKKTIVVFTKYGATLLIFSIKILCLLYAQGYSMTFLFKYKTLLLPKNKAPNRRDLRIYNFKFLFIAYKINGKLVHQDFLKKISDDSRLTKHTLIINDRTWILSSFYYPLIRRPFCSVSWCGVHWGLPLNPPAILPLVSFGLRSHTALPMQTGLYTIRRQLCLPPRQFLVQEKGTAAMPAYSRLNSLKMKTMLKENSPKLFVNPLST